MKLRTSILAKSIAWLLIAVTGLGLVLSGLLAVNLEVNGFYEKNYTEIKKEAFASYHDRYSARVLDYLYAKENTNQEYFKSRSFRYGVIEADFLSEIERLNLNDKKHYIDSNFDFEKELKLEDLHIFQCTVNENTRFASENPDSLSGYYWISNTSGSWQRYEIDGFVYDVETGIIFATAEGGYYPVPKVILNITYNGGEIQQCFAFNKEKANYQLQKSGTIIEDDVFGQQQYDAGLEIFIDTDEKKEEIERLLKELNVISVEKGITFLELRDTLLAPEYWGEIQFSSREEHYGVSSSETESQEEVLYNEQNGEVNHQIFYQETTVPIYDVQNQETTNTQVPSDSNNRAADNETSYMETDNTYREEVYDTGSYSSATTVLGINLAYDALVWDMIDDNIHKEVHMNAEEMAVYVKPENIEADSYYVLSYREDGYLYDTNVFSGVNDVFGTFELVVGTLYQMRYDVFGIFFGCLIVFFGSFIFLCCAAGYKKGQSGLVEKRINRIPFEVYVGVMAFAEFAFMVIFAQAFNEVRSLTDVFWFVIMLTALLFGGLLAVIAALEVITRIKLWVLWKNTFCCWGINKLFGGYKQAVAFLVTHLSLVWKVGLLFGANAIIDMIIMGIMNGNGGLGVIAFVLKNAVLLLAIFSVISQLNKLKDAGEHMAKGSLNYRVDTKGMLWEFKRHAEHLNSVGEGLAIAVEERMKSEHFKTELITNVSHDIKTPLTSIINYVDLIQKEEAWNENVEEYLEVLERQSKRLKKLLEDLMEASKASTGTLPVELETLEAGVFMVQTVGEFEEKTKDRELELIIKKPEKPIFIYADGRHFWRVIDNLMNNICKYAQPNTRVYINLEATTEEVFITFRNTSRYPLNITSEELKERFVRGDESRHTEGSGLGLSIAQSLMELMKGRFDLVVDGDLFKVILVFRRVEK